MAMIAAKARYVVESQGRSIVVISVSLEILFERGFNAGQKASKDRRSDLGLRRLDGGAAMTIEIR